MFIPDSSQFSPPWPGQQRHSRAVKIFCFSRYTGRVDSLYLQYSKHITRFKRLRVVSDSHCQTCQMSVYACVYEFACVTEVCGELLVCCPHIMIWQSGEPLGQGLWDLMVYFSVPQDTAMVTTRRCTYAHQFLGTKRMNNTPQF